MRKIVHILHAAVLRVFGGRGLTRRFPFLYDLNMWVSRIIGRGAPKTTIVHEDLTIFLDKFDSGGIAWGGYQKEVADAIREHLTPQSIFVDVGANIGYFSLLAAKAGVEVYALEPFEGNLDLLKRNVFANGMSERIHIVPKAAYSVTGKVDLYIDEYNAGGHSIINKDNKLGHVEIETVRLDDLLAQVDVSLIKIDVEDAEQYVFAGAVELLRRDITWIVESRNSSYINSLANQYGFILKKITSDDYLLNKA